MAATRFLRDARSGADICLCLWACICVCLWAPLGRVCSAPALRFYAAEVNGPSHGARVGGGRCASNFPGPSKEGCLKLCLGCDAMPPWSALALPAFTPTPWLGFGGRQRTDARSN
jgi:hypothetical protein